MPALFNSQAIFGSAVSVVPMRNPQQVQRTSYPGVNGIFGLAMGSRGGAFTVTGRLFGSSPLVLAAQEAIFRSYQDGNAYTLVDTTGLTWTKIELESFEPQGRILFDPVYGYTRRYQARFFSYL